MPDMKLRSSATNHTYWILSHSWQSTSSFKDGYQSIGVATGVGQCHINIAVDATQLEGLQWLSCPACAMVFTRGFPLVEELRHQGLWACAMVCRHIMCYQHTIHYREGDQGSRTAMYVRRSHPRDRVVEILGIQKICFFQTSDNYSC